MIARGWVMFKCCSWVVSLYVVGLSKYIKRGWGEFSRYTRFEVGDGSKIRFWVSDPYGTFSEIVQYCSFLGCFHGRSFGPF
jgi:hypothetical protein